MRTSSTSAAAAPSPSFVCEVCQLEPVVPLQIGRDEFDELLRRLNGALCIVGAVREALRDDGHRGGALGQALKELEHVASELDAAEPRVNGGVASTRTAGSRDAAEAASEPQERALPRPLYDHLLEQTDRMAELQSLIERLDADEGSPLFTRTAVRMAKELQDAIDPVTIGRVMHGENA